MIQTNTYISAINNANPGFSSMERGRLDKEIHIQRSNGDQFRMELVPSAKLANIVGPDRALQRVKYSNMGDFGAKVSNTINNWH